MLVGTSVLFYVLQNRGSRVKIDHLVSIDHAFDQLSTWLRSQAIDLALTNGSVGQLSVSIFGQLLFSSEQKNP